VSSETARLFARVHLSAKRFICCAVDRKWRMASNVNSVEFTEAGL
jgi:predicted HD phosphohydrolase